MAVLEEDSHVIAQDRFEKDFQIAAKALIDIEGAVAETPPSCGIELLSGFFGLCYLLQLTLYAGSICYPAPQTPASDMTELRKETARKFDYDGPLA